MHKLDLKWQIKVTTRNGNGETSEGDDDDRRRWGVNGCVSGDCRLNNS